MLIFQICTVQWLNCTNLKYELNRSHNREGVVYVLKVRHIDQHDSMPPEFVFWAGGWQPHGCFKQWIFLLNFFGEVRTLQSPDSLYTVRMISIAHFSVHILLLHHYRSDLSHISDFDSLVIGLSKSERWAKILEKRMTSSICTKFAHFWVVLVRKCMVQKFLISYRFDFFDRFVSSIFW